MSGDAGRPFRGTIEDLIRRIESLPDPGSTGAELWIPGRLTLRGEPVPQDVAMVIVLDALLSKSLIPSGFTEAQDGRLYRYEYSDDLVGS
jgi:hypothetical protein